MAFAFKLRVVWLVLAIGACSPPRPSPGSAQTEAVSPHVAKPQPPPTAAPAEIAPAAAAPAALNENAPAAAAPTEIAPAVGPTANAPAAAAAPAAPTANAPAAAIANAASAEPPPDAPPDDSGWGVAAGLRYLEIVRGDAAPDATLPLLIVIHGLGDRPHPGWLYAIDVDAKLAVRMILPQAPTPYGNGFAWFPFRFQDRDEVALAGGIREAEVRLARMIEQLKQQRPTRGRAVVTGFSQGGMLSYALALTHPELIQFALPISGELPQPLWPAQRPKRGSVPRILGLHGTADTVVAYEADDKLAQHLRGLGYPLELVPFQDVRHQISEQMSARATRELSAAIAAIPSARGKH
jgi:phospholipase/carboxylesterase